MNPVLCFPRHKNAPHLLPIKYQICLFALRGCSQPHENQWSYRPPAYWYQDDLAIQPYWYYSGPQLVLRQNNRGRSF